MTRLMLQDPHTLPNKSIVQLAQKQAR